jgi:hypothetical protein
VKEDFNLLSQFTTIKIVVLEHTSEALTEYLGQNVPSLASYSVNVYIYKTKVWVYIKLKHDL